MNDLIKKKLKNIKSSSPDKTKHLSNYFIETKKEKNIKT